MSAFVMAPFSSACAQGHTLVITDAWIRVTPGTDMAAAYLTLTNNSSTPITVIGIRSPVAAQSMIHETRVQEGQSRMRAHDQIVVPAGGTVKLAPGGLHVMLQGLSHPPGVGEKVPLLVRLADGVDIQAQALVRPLTAE